MFETAGFEIVLLEYCDENGQFYYKNGMQMMALFSDQKI